MVKPNTFRNQSDLRDWLAANHKTETELWVGFYKVHTDKFNMTWSQSVDEALCFGWIDGIRRSIDETSYCIRFTPRKPTSSWSKINLKKIETLTQKGLMHQAGLDAYKKRKVSESNEYSFENGPQQLADNYAKMFRANKIAWKFFTTQAPSYQKTIIHWIMAAKKEKTQISRLNKAIIESGKQKRIF